MTLFKTFKNTQNACPKKIVFLMTLPLKIFVFT